MDQIKGELGTEIDEEIAQTGVLDVSSQVKAMPTKLTRLIEDRLAPTSREFEASARAACEKLQSRYPCVRVGETGGVSVRISSDAAWVPIAVGGTAVAGSAAAGAIAAANVAALASTATVAVPSVISSLLPMLGLEILAPLATGTATVAAPAAITATPLWVALAGPVGWTAAGIGVLAVPFAWRLSKVKQRDRLYEACHEQVRSVMKKLQDERLPKLREMGECVLEEFHVRLDRQLNQIEGAMLRARDSRSDPSAVQRTAELAAEMNSVMNSLPVSTTQGLDV